MIQALVPAGAGLVSATRKTRDPFLPAYLSDVGLILTLVVLCGGTLCDAMIEGLAAH